MANPRRVFRDPRPDPADDYSSRQALVRSIQAQGRTVIGPADERWLPAGSPKSPGGVKVTDSEVEFKTLTGLVMVAFAEEVENGNSGSAATINWANGMKQSIILTDDAFIEFEDPPGVCNVLLRVVQDGTGGWSPTWDSRVLWPANQVPNLGAGQSGQPNRPSIISFYYDGINYHGVATRDFR